MRILILIKGLGRGGAEQLLAAAIPYLNRDRFEYELAYLLPHKDALVKEFEDHGIPVRCLDGAGGISWVGRLRRLVRERGYGLIHSHLPYSAIGARLGAPRSTRLVYTEHNVWERYHRATYWANLLTYRRNAHVFAVSEEVRLSTRYPRAFSFLPMPPVETLHHGIDHRSMERWSDSDGVREELGINGNAPVVGSVGNLKPSKGQEHLIEATAIVRSGTPDVRCVIVGLGPRSALLRERAHELGLDGVVTFAGYREDAPRIAGSFDIFVQPSEREGLPIALIEAMALGRPVVATRVGGTPELVRDGVDGILVPPRDPAALADAIIALLRDPERRVRMGEAARRRAAGFDIRNAVRRMQEVYEEILT